MAMIMMLVTLSVVSFAMLVRLVWNHDQYYSNSPAIHETSNTHKSVQNLDFNSLDVYP
jgi:hypothetical protein